MESRIHVSNVGLYDSEAKKAVKIRYGFNPDTGEKLRISKRTGRILKKPKFNSLKREKRGKNKSKGLKDTSNDLVNKVTY